MKKKLLLLILPLLMICLLTGCVQKIDCVTNGLPKGAQTYFLTKNSRESEVPDFLELKNTEIDSYLEDDWQCVSYITDDVERVKEVGPIKILVYDEKGNILKISPEFSLAIKDKNYYWDKIVYNYESNTIEGAHVAKVDKTLSIWIMRLLFIDFFCFLILIVVVAGTNGQHYKKNPLFAVLLNIPNVLLAVWWGIDSFSSYYQKPQTSSVS